MGLEGHSRYGKATIVSMAYDPRFAIAYVSSSGAGPVYRLLGKKDMDATEFPPIETGFMEGEVAFRQHSGGHTDGPNWPTFLTFANRHIKGPPLPAGN